MKIGIIAASSNRQAEVVEESVQSFFKYGNFNYHLITLKRGEITEPLDELDALLIHYSCIAFPYRYGLPISALSALKLNQFSGLKLAFAQDEQRAGYERLDFLRSVGINHLFSVAPENLYNVLYPIRWRNFSISNLLTGYISEKHVQVSLRNIPISDRPIDLAYRGRKLPDWMGLTGTLKGDIPKLLKDNLGKEVGNFQIDVSSEENSRIYGDKWFDFLLRSKVSIGTPSGSDYLDLWGRENEKWVKNDKNVEFSLEAPLKANYNVISPRYFDYVAAGNLVALTKGSYSGIPNNKDFINIEIDMSDIKSVLQFSRSIVAQKIVDKAKLRVLSREDLKYSAYVKKVESIILSQKRNYTIPKTSSQFILKKSKVSIANKFSENIISKISRILKSTDALHENAIYFRNSVLKLKILISLQNYTLIKNLPTFEYRDYLNLKLIIEIKRLNEALIASKNPPRVCKLKNGFVKIDFGSEMFLPVREINLQKYLKTDFWLIDLSCFGKISDIDHLYALPKKLKFNISFLEILINNLIKT